MDAFEAPEGDQSGEVQSANPGWTVVVGGIGLGLAGFTLAASGVQVLVFVRIQSAAAIVPWLMLLLGVAGLLLGGMLSRGRDWAGMAGVAVSALMALLANGWLIYAIAGGFISLLGALAGATALLSVPLVLLSLPAALRASRARRALYQ